MTPTKSGDQDVEIGDVFMEMTEKTQLPGFRFYVAGIWCLAEAKEGSRRRSCAWRIKTWGFVIHSSQSGSQNGNHG